jgi:hypothetical protein
MSAKTGLSDIAKTVFILSLFGFAVWSATLWPRTGDEVSGKPIVDGVIGLDEYPHSESLNALRLYWFNDEENLYMGIVSPGYGWVGIGFSPLVAHSGANFVLGAVVENMTVVSDHYGSMPYLHEPDTGLGGGDDILEYAGVELSGTVLEFHIRLNSGDPYDAVLEAGKTYNCLVAYNSSDDDFSVKHSDRIKFVLTLD